MPHRLPKNSMYIGDILGTAQKLCAEQVFPIRDSCYEFLKESNGYPVFKQLPEQYGVCSKVKVRHKPNLILEQFFKKTVMQDCSTLVESYSMPIAGAHNYWIFPINGYKYIYNPLIADYKSKVNQILDITSDKDVILELIGDLYNSNNLITALTCETEILWYKISHFYAVDCSKFEDYDELLKIL